MLWQSPLGVHTLLQLMGKLRLSQNHAKEKGQHWVCEWACLTPRPVGLSTTLVLQAGLTPYAKKSSSPGRVAAVLWEPQRQLRAK